MINILLEIVVEVEVVDFVVKVGGTLHMLPSDGQHIAGNCNGSSEIRSSGSSDEGTCCVSYTFIRWSTYCWK